MASGGDMPQGDEYDEEREHMAQNTIMLGWCLAAMFVFAIGVVVMLYAFAAIFGSSPDAATPQVTGGIGTALSTTAP